MNNLTPSLYSAGSLGAAGYGVEAYSEQGGALSVNPSLYNPCVKGGSLASKGLKSTLGGKKRKAGKAKKSKKTKKTKKTKKSKKRKSVKKK